MSLISLYFRIKHWLFYLFFILSYPNFILLTKINHLKDQTRRLMQTPKIKPQQNNVHNKTSIEFHDSLRRTASFESSVQLQRMQFTEVDELTQSTIFSKGKSKKVIPQSKSDPSLNGQQLIIAHSFNLDLKLLSMFRNPLIADNQQFDECFIQELKRLIEETGVEQRGQVYVIYMHLVFAQIYNLTDFQKLGESREELPQLSKVWNQTNIMNTYCIIENLKSKGPIEVKDIPIKNKKGAVIIQVIRNQDVCSYHKFNDTLTLSQNYLDKAIESQGFLDVYFCPLIMSKLDFTAIYRCFTNLPDIETTQLNYAKTFIEIIQEGKLKIDFEKWYKEQVGKIIKGECDFNQIRNLIANHANGYRNQFIERLLIGLQGWSSHCQQAIKLLNVYYDHSDWQIRAPFHPIIAQQKEKFNINYLIENTKDHRELITVCLKCPCFNSRYNEEVFSWHRPRLNEYTSDQATYLWVQLDLGQFPKCGFYDWKLFMFRENGKNQGINKIFNIAENRKLESQILKRKVHIIKRVQGRFIVHPQKTRQMQLHEIDMDLLSIQSNQHQKIPNFIDASQQIQKSKQYGIDCVYLMGAFERDTGQFGQTIKGFKRPQASPLALTCRKTPCKMLGGQSKFLQLIKNAHSIDMKIITDCTQRVSSTRMNKRYQNLLLSYLDDTGKKQILYGSDGKSVNFDDSAILNYRKKVSWDLLLSQAVQVIQKYNIDGVYLDNGFSWPTIFQADEDQLFRKESDGSQAYSNDQIFEGEIILKGKKEGYWKSNCRRNYANPFIMQFCKRLWTKFPSLLIISEGFESAKQQDRAVSIINSGPIPRVFNMPKAISQVFGYNLSESGVMNKVQQKNIVSLKKWYQQIKKFLPRNSIVVQSTTSHAWPYPAYIFKQATWAVIDLFFFMPQLPMTFIGQQSGKAFRQKATSIFISIDKKNENKQQSPEHKSFKKVHSSFFKEMESQKRQSSLIKGINPTVRDPHQIPYLQEKFRKQVGPEFGFDLAKIYKHYAHRSKLRRQLELLTSGKMMSVSAQHMYGVHTRVLSFVKWNQKQALLICINFNGAAIDMHFNLSNLRYVFSNAKKSSLVVRVKDLLQTNGIDQLFTVSELINSRIEAHLEKYKSLIWRICPEGSEQQALETAYQHSARRVIQRISAQPAKWIYSSVLTNELIRIVQITKNPLNFVTALKTLYERLIKPNQINFGLLICKTHEFWVNKRKLAKLFALLKATEESQQLSEVLRQSIKAILMGNKLGPIAFVTPQIGKWSSVGGLGVMVDQLSKELVKLGEEVYLITPYYEYNKKNETDYLIKDGFDYAQNIMVGSGGINYQFGIHRGKYFGVNYIWLHNPQLFSKPYVGQAALYVSKQLVFFALSVLETFCQLKIFPSTIVTNDWMCGFVSAYVKVNKYKDVFNGTKFMHICHNLDPLYQGRLYPKFQQGNLNWLIQLPQEWYVQYRDNKLVINPSKCALQTSDNWGTVSNSYKHDLLSSSPLSHVLWKHPHPFSFPNGVRKQQRLHIIQTQTPGTHIDSKKILQKKYFSFENLDDSIPLFAFIGRVTKQKGVHLIVDAVEAILYQYNFKVQFLIGGPADSKQQYGRHCANRMKYLTKKYPLCVWSDPQSFFLDGPLVNIGADYAMMPSQFEPGGIVQHQFFAGKTPVVAFRTGGLKDTVFEYDHKTQKGNGFNFMSYDSQDFKRCLRRAIECYKNKKHYEKLRENAFESVVEQEDVAKGWNNEFYRMQNKIYVEWDLVDRYFNQLKGNSEKQQQIKVLQSSSGQMWKQEWDIKKDFMQVLIGAARIKGKTQDFVYQTKKVPRPKQVMICGSWDNWQGKHKMHFDQLHKNWLCALKLTPGTYNYKYLVDSQWALNQNQTIETDLNGTDNHIITIQ